MITHVLKNCSKTSLICWVKPSTTPNEAIEKNVFQISKNVLLWISLKSVPSGLSPRDHDMMESAIENFEEVIRTRPHKPRSMWCVCCQQSTCPNAIQYQAKDNQQFVRAISINKYLTKKKSVFYMMFSEYVTDISNFTDFFSFLRFRIRSKALPPQLWLQQLLWPPNQRHPCGPWSTSCAVKRWNPTSQGKTW